MAVRIYFLFLFFINEWDTSWKWKEVNATAGLKTKTMERIGVD